MQRRQPAESSEGENFNFDRDDFNDSSSDEVQAEDTWQPVVLGPTAKRTEFEKVSCSSSL